MYPGRRMQIDGERPHFLALQDHLREGPIAWLQDHLLRRYAQELFRNQWRIQRTDTQREDGADVAEDCLQNVFVGLCGILLG